MTAEKNTPQTLRLSDISTISPPLRRGDEGEGVRIF